MIKDSGQRTEFETGAQRDMQDGKGDMVSIPWEAILRLSKHYEAGAQKYKRWNYRLGIPVSSFIDSACRHLAKYQCGMDDEDHLAAAAFNVLGAMLMENTKPEMQDLPLRAGKKTYGYFDTFQSSYCSKCINRDHDKDTFPCALCAFAHPDKEMECFIERDE